MNYAFNYTDRIAEGFSGNGFVICADERQSDNGMHGFARHMIGHILFSCWIVTNGFEDHCPRWAWIGAAHFLEKLLDIHDEYATLLRRRDAGQRGPAQAVAEARARHGQARRCRPSRPSSTRTRSATSRYEDHLRAWSIMDLMLREDRDRWLALLAELRNAAQEGAAFKKVLGHHAGPVPRALGGARARQAQDDGGDPRATATTRTSPAGASAPASSKHVEPEILAGRIRGLDVVKDAKLAEAVRRRDSTTDADLVRETIHLVLLRADGAGGAGVSPRARGSTTRVPWSRAGVARVLGQLRDAASRARLEELLDDRHWLVRANAA